MSPSTGSSFWALNEIGRQCEDSVSGLSLSVRLISRHRTDSRASRLLRSSQVRNCAGTRHVRERDMKLLLSPRTSVCALAHKVQAIRSAVAQALGIWNLQPHRERHLHATGLINCRGQGRTGVSGTRKAVREWPKWVSVLPYWLWLVSICSGLVFAQLLPAFALASRSASAIRHPKTSSPTRGMFS
jgi:hypothetical protein